MSGVQNELIDDVVGGVIVIDSVHHEAHESEIFEVYLLDIALADDGYLHILFKPRGETAHIAVSAACGGDALLRLSEAPTTSANGSNLQERNLNRIVQSGIRRDTAKAVIYSGPTVTDPGVVLFQGLLPGGTKSQAAGGAARSNIERILSGDFNYLVSVQNIAGATKPSSLLIQWYAH